MLRYAKFAVALIYSIFKVWWYAHWLRDDLKKNEPLESIVDHIEKRIPKGDFCYGCPWYQGDHCELLEERVGHPPDYRPIKICAFDGAGFDQSTLEK